MMSALGHKQTRALQYVMSAFPPIATAKAYSRNRSSLLSPRKRTCAAEQMIIGQCYKHTSKAALEVQLFQSALPAIGSGKVERGSIGGERFVGKKGANEQRSERADDDWRAALSQTGSDGGGPKRQEHSQNPANHGEPPQNRHHDTPTAAPDVVHAHDCQASHKEKNARDEDRPW